MAGKICIHGHFYQPPREDPWLDEILPEGSAAPFLNWNERIGRESYAPLAWARRLDEHGKIVEIFNSYEWISFNVGPTLLRWLEKKDPLTYSRMLEGDRKSLSRLGHGNAFAQIYHHVIMPLATPMDKEAEVAWAVADFEAGFGRKPEGMWLSEAAVDTPTLEILADYGIKFTIMAPRQAQAIADLGGENWRDVNEAELNILEPYYVDLPTKRKIAVFFYNGPISQAVAFERLLDNGENFWRRVSGFAQSGLVSVATDGETYGHHFKFGEMALAYVLDQGRRGRDGWGCTNYAAYLAENPPGKKVRIHENSSWSCAHGIERWRSDCGCTTGGHQGWNQKWRQPLREAMNEYKNALDVHYLHKGNKIFHSPYKAMIEYGRILSGAEKPEAFESRHFIKGLEAGLVKDGWRLLAAQRWALAGFASCAWFFDDIGRIEPVNGMTYALRSMELMKETGGPNFEPEFERILSRAQSNDPELGSGADIFNSEVKTRRGTPGRLTAQAVLTAKARAELGNGKAEISWAGVEAHLSGTTVASDRNPTLLSGKVRLYRKPEQDSKICAWSWKIEDNDWLNSKITVKAEHNDLSGTQGEESISYRDLSWNKRQAVGVAFVESTEKEAWERDTAKTMFGCGLYQKFVEAQVVQTMEERWARLRTPLFWAWLCGADIEPSLEEQLLDWFKKNLETHPDKAVITFRAGKGIVEELKKDEPDWTWAEGFINRCLRIGLQPDWWEAQNILFSTWPNKREAKGIRGLLGFET